MKQFQKYGVAAAVASIATGAFAQSEISQNEAGDLAIVPYYTVENGQNTGIHIINTTAKTQVVKVRLRRGSDSKDALDFNLVMSAYDEWTANIGAGGPNGVQVTTNDTTCTVPAFTNGKIANMPDTYSAGATEGYVEIIGMGETSANLFAAYADHGTTGVPADCAAVREHFYRVSASATSTLTEILGLLPAVRGVHTSALTSSGKCSAGSGVGNGKDTGGACSGGAASNLATFVDTPKTALKVSWMVTDSDSGLEMGDNAVHIENFAEAPMMTNQQPLSFGTNGQLNYDPLNFELPNLAYGAWKSSEGARQTEGADTSAGSISSGALFDNLRAALQADNVVNDWAAFETDAAEVATDWVVTLPGQYVMTNPICDAYSSYAEAKTACAVTSATVLTGISSLAALDKNELPLTLASSTTTNPLSGDSNLTLWDREEQGQNVADPTVSDGLGFSPGGSVGTPTAAAYLWREVNVISFNDGNVLKSKELQSDDGTGNGLRVVVDVPGADKGWGNLEIEQKAGAMRWTPEGETILDDGDINPNGNAVGTKDGWGGFTALGEQDNVAVVGFAAWSRKFTDQDRSNYGRAVEHSTVTSSGGSR